MSKKKVIALIGNPNCGKSTLFNAITGSKQITGNWPGVTVEKNEGETVLSGENVKVVDLPGVYSLTATSEDERATLQYVLSHEADLYINVIDATTLERNLYLTLLLCELHVPMVVVVTMADIARQRNIDIELDHLAEHLGVSVISVNANNPLDVRKVTALTEKALKESRLPSIRMDYGNELEQEIDILASCTVKTAQALKVTKRWVAIKALEGEPLVTKALLDYHDMAPEVIEGAISRVTNVLKDPPDIELAEARYGVIAGLVHDVVHVRQSKAYLSEVIDRFVLNRFLGLPLFFAIMAGVFCLVSFASGSPTDFFEASGTYLLQELPTKFLAGFCHAPDWLVSVIAGGIGGAMNVLFSFVPIIFCMFLALSVLEDSGYMARAAFLADRFMHTLGLPGKSFVPLLVGFGCTVPAIMATRTLESKRDRVLTIFMIPFMSCGAKLPVYAAFAAAFCPHSPAKMMLMLYLTGIVLGVFNGLALKKTLLRGEPAHFIMELPPYHIPRIRHILFHTWERLVGFIWRAGRFIVPMMLVLGLLNTFDIHGNVHEGEASQDTLLSCVGKAITPAFEPIGVTNENWPASVAVFTGLFAKESVVGTLNGLYEQEAAQRDEEEKASGDFDSEMRRHFPKGFHQAFAFLIFILLYVPCIGATAVAFKEIGKLYGCIFVGYLTTLGWCFAAMYHAAMVSHNVTWFATALAVLLSLYCTLAFIGRKTK